MVSSGLDPDIPYIPGAGNEIGIAPIINKLLSTSPHHRRSFLNKSRVSVCALMRTFDGVDCLSRKMTGFLVLAVSTSSSSPSPVVPTSSVGLLITYLCSFSLCWARML